MPRPEGYASLQFNTVESSGKQSTVQCRHCRDKKLARSVASRKVKHLQRCTEFHRYLAELAHKGSEQLNEVPLELMRGFCQQRHSQPTQQMQETPRRIDDSLPALLDGLRSARQTESVDPSVDGFRDWNQRPGADIQMNDPTPESVVTRPVRVTTNAQASVPDRQVASAHRAAQRRKERLDGAITRAIYEGSLPFNVTDELKHPALAEFFRLVDYTPPSRQRIADDIYDQANDQVQQDRIIQYAS